MKVERIAEPIVVTGATGFIGRSLVNRLLEEGYRKVRALVLPADPLPRAWLGPEPGRDRVDIVRGDVTRLGDVAAVMGDAKTVFHLAAKVGDWGHPEEHHRITVMGTEHVLGEAARRQARVIMTSSVVVYGRQIGQKVCDEQTPMGAPLGPYSASKQAQERCGLRLEASHGLKLTVVRPTNVYGPGSIPWVHEAA
ncbi:MAG: NAD-dependent epimerase/dehydratase family protein, partial [Myxococcota bacterium]